MKLYCVRHGEACGSDVDPQRGLTDNGRAEIERMAHYLVRCDMRVSHLLHSSKTRAAQTAAIFSEVANISDVTETDSLLQPMAELAPVLSMVETMTDNTMLVGHLPMIGQLVNALTLGDALAPSVINFSPGSVVCLERCIGLQGWVINWVLRPPVVPVL